MNQCPRSVYFSLRYGNAVFLTNGKHTSKQKPEMFVRLNENKRLYSYMFAQSCLFSFASLKSRVAFSNQLEPTVFQPSNQTKFQNHGLHFNFPALRTGNTLHLNFPALQTGYTLHLLKFSRAAHRLHGTMVHTIINNYSPKWR